MCKSCQRVFPSYAEVQKYFYLHNGTLYRQSLPKSEFKHVQNWGRYNSKANQPATIYNKGNNVYIVGFGQLPIGVVKAIMAGKNPGEWYHRAGYEEFQSRKYPVIPRKIYKNGFLERVR